MIQPPFDGFRPGEDLAPGELPSLEDAEFGFTEAANAGGTDFDVLMGYQLLLGRDPENSFVIADAKSSPVCAFIRALIGSGEFQSAVLDKLDAGRALPHESASPSPTPRHVDWLLRHVTLPGFAATMLRTAPTWRDFLRVLLAVPGVPRPPPRVAAASNGHEKPALEAAAADEGFVLIHLEQPKPGDPIYPGTLLNGSGWTIAPADVTEVAVLLDDAVLTHAHYGLPRPDVARSFPHYRHVDHCGFAFSAEIPQDASVTPRSQLTVRVRTGRGDEGFKSLRLLPPQEAAPASGAADDPLKLWPIRLSVDEAVIDERRVLRLRGWSTARAGLRTVDVTLGDTPLGTAITGLPRPDIAQAHPDYPDAAESGFALVHALDAAVPPGPSFVRVQARDAQGQTRQTLVPLVVPAAETEADEPDENFAARLEEGTQGAENSGISCACDILSLCDDGRLAVSGWAVAEGGIESVVVMLDEQQIGSAVLGRPRPDVGRHFPQNSGAANAGFLLGHTLPAPPAPGSHLVSLLVYANDGGLRMLELPVVPVPPADMPIQAADIFDALNPRAGGPSPRHMAEMRLELDLPVRDGEHARETVRGSLTFSGWAVARTGIAGIAVFAGGELLGHAHMGMRREDIGAAFADYPESLLSGYALVLPPGVLKQGRHDIKVVATGKPEANEAGEVDGQAKGQGAAPTAEIAFSLTVEPFDSLPPGGEPRDRLPPAELGVGLSALESAGVQPVFEALIGMASGDEAECAALATTLGSVSAQAYPHFSARVFLPARLADAARRKILALVEGAGAPVSVAGAKPLTQPSAGRAPPPLKTGRGLSHARKKADFFVCVRPGDRLGCDALLEMALESACARDADFIYADELRFDPAQQRKQPFFKPDWSPDLLLSMNFVGRLWAASAPLVEAAGFTPETLAAAADYDAVLRLTEQANAIAHVPRVLCARGAAGDGQAEELAALKAALARRRIKASVENGAVPGTWRVRRLPARQRRADPGCVPGLVSVIIPTRSTKALVRVAITSIRATTSPSPEGEKRIEIVVVDNTPPADKRGRTWLRKHADTVVDMQEPFNWSRFNNAGAAAAHGEFFLFLNDDIEVSQPDWLDALLEHARRPEIGVVGARLLYPQGTVQHAGQYLCEGHARHAFRFADANNPGPFGLASVTREVISVTGACQMMHRRVFASLGGFEEAHSIVNNDLDFCLRSWQAGLAVLYTPHATLVHHELASRAALEDTYDEARFTGAWRNRFLAGDPFRNPHLGPDSDFYGPEPEPVVTLAAGRRLPLAQNVARILVVKLDHIGDFLTCLPALRALGERFAHAKIDLLVPSATASLVGHVCAEASVSVADVAVFDFFHARSGQGRKALGEAELDALKIRLAPKHYDLAIDLRMHPDTRPVLQYTGARFLAGYDHADRFPWLDVALAWEGDMRLVLKRAHISERLMQLVSAVADASTDVAHASPAPSRRAAPEPAARVQAWAELPAKFRARPVACIHPGVGNVVRQWPASSYVALIDLLAAELGLHAVLVGSAEEAPIADEILRRVRDPASVRSLVGLVKLAQLPAVMRACVLFVGNNSGPQHLAASLGLPSIGIHSGVVDATEWAPLGARAMAIRRRMVCSPCYLEFPSDCPRGLACLTGLPPRHVFAACRRLLAGTV